VSSWAAEPSCCCTTSKAGSATFSGYFSGTITANSANIQIMPTTPTTKTVILGGNTYTVTMGTYSPPGPPGASNAGSLNAIVSATAGTGGGGRALPDAPPVPRGATAPGVGEPNGATAGRPGATVWATSRCARYSHAR